VVRGPQKLGLTPVTIDAVDRSGRLPNGQPVTNIPRGLDVVSQAFNSDVGVDNEPIAFGGGYVWYDVVGITPTRERTLDEVRSQVEAKWREDQISSKLGRRRPKWCRSSSKAARLPQRRPRSDPRLRLLPVWQRTATPSGVPSAVVTPRSERPRTASAQTPGAGGSEWIVFRVTDISVPPVDTASDEFKKMKDTLQRGWADEEIAQYVRKIESEIGTTINQSAFAQVTGANKLSMIDG